MALEPRGLAWLLAGRSWRRNCLLSSWHFDDPKSSAQSFISLKKPQNHRGWLKASPLLLSFGSKPRESADSFRYNMKIIFFHGLESGPGARKHRWLQENYDSVVCVDMYMSVANPIKSHSIARNAIANLLFTAPWNLLSRSIETSLEQCLSCQVEEMNSVGNRDGVVIGSSWGGAVATLAIARGLWKGPAVLIAPAYSAAMARFGAYSPENGLVTVHALISERLKSSDYSGQVIIVHGTADETIPIEHSREMAVTTGIRLVEVEGADHSMRCLFQDGGTLLKSVIRDAQLSNDRS